MSKKNIYTKKTFVVTGIILSSLFLLHFSDSNERLLSSVTCGLIGFSIATILYNSNLNKIQKNFFESSKKITQNNLNEYKTLSTTLSQNLQSIHQKIDSNSSHKNPNNFMDPQLFSDYSIIPALNKTFSYIIDPNPKADSASFNLRNLKNLLKKRGQHINVLKYNTQNIHPKPVDSNQEFSSKVEFPFNTFNLN